MSRALDEAELGALLCSRLCHDLISPVGATGNGAELIRELAPELSAEVELLEDSSRAAAAALEFFRIAFGAAPPGARVGVGRLRATAEARFARDRVALRWPAPPDPGAEAGRPAGRLLLDMLLIGASALPRGGALDVSARFGPSGAAALQVGADGPSPRLPDHAEAWLAGEDAPSPAPGEVHFPLARLNALACGAALRVAWTGNGLVLSADIPAEAAAPDGDGAAG